MNSGQTDSDYIYSIHQQRRLAQNLAAIYSDFESGQYSSAKYSIDLFCEWHHRLFDSVRDHAGRLRCPDFGPEILTFGPNRSVHRDIVHRELRRHCDTANRLIREARAMAPKLDIKFVHEAIKVAVFIHADLIRIHPFIDGNGRVGRLILDWILQLFEFPCMIAFNIPAQEYREALNLFYSTHEIDPLADLILRVISYGIA
jgi:fido (protein-threonine AMPylation protein)